MLLLQTRLQQGQVAKHWRQAERSMCLCSNALLQLANSCSAMQELPLLAVMLLLVALLQSVLMFSLLQRLGR
jgi:hypothetical protein